jgi:hypothetical protein
MITTAINPIETYFIFTLLASPERSKNSGEAGKVKLTLRCGILIP